MNQLFPVFLKLENLKVLLVGGGNVGLEKLSAILNNSPATKVKIVAPLIKSEIFSLAQNHTLEICERPFVPNDLDGCQVVFCATDQPKLHADIVLVAHQKRLLVNVADTPDLCDFYLGSIVQKGDLKIGISTNGKSPTFGKRLKEVLNEVLPESIDDILQNLEKIRNTLKGDFQEKIKQLDNLTSVLKK